MPDMLARLHATFDTLGGASKKMFGGVCFMLNGNMVAGTSKRGLLVRVGKEFDNISAKREDAHVMDMGGRVMAGYWFVDNEVDDSAYQFWIAAALAHNKMLEPK